MPTYISPEVCKQIIFTMLSILICKQLLGKEKSHCFSLHFYYSDNEHLSIINYLGCLAEQQFFVRHCADWLVKLTKSLASWGLFIFSLLMSMNSSYCTVALCAKFDSELCLIVAEWHHIRPFLSLLYIYLLMCPFSSEF